MPSPYACDPVGNMRARTASVMGLVLALAGCGADRRPPSQPAAPRVATVVQDDAEMLYRSQAQLAATLDDLRDLGVDWVRVTAGWSGTAPDPRAAQRPDFDAADPGAYPAGAWSRLDRAVRMARERGLEVAIDIAFWAPRWAVARAGPEVDQQRDSIDVAAYADFAEAVARRYPYAVAFTVWNEPNLGVFWLPQFQRTAGGWEPAAPHRYRAMVQATVPRIRAAAPRALVLIGATSSLGADVGTDADDRMSPLTFVREMACVDEQLEPLDRPECRAFRSLPGDGWSHHPYSSELRPWEHDPEPGTARMGDLGRLSGLLGRLHAAGRTRKRLPLYLTEYGYQTNPPDPTWDTTLAEQARWLSEAERIARAEPTVRSVSQFLVRDLPERPGADARTRWRDYQSGLRFESGEPKPAHAAYALPLVARRAGPGRVAFWGLVRPGAKRREARLAIRAPDGSWRTLARPRTREDGTFEVTAGADPAGTFRLESGGRTGAPLVGAR